jgi:hypothetical protein
VTQTPFCREQPDARSQIANGLLALSFAWHIVCSQFYDNHCSEGVNTMTKGILAKGIFSSVLGLALVGLTIVLIVSLI